MLSPGLAAARHVEHQTEQLPADVFDRGVAGGDAAGINLHVFTTGRGTPYGLAEVPVIKVATCGDLARRWHDLMDVNAGRIAEGSATIEEVGWELFRLMLDVASGRKKTWAEHWKLHNALVLFNPAPVT